MVIVFFFFLGPLGLSPREEVTFWCLEGRHAEILLPWPGVNTLAFLVMKRASHTAMMVRPIWATPLEMTLKTWRGFPPTHLLFRPGEREEDETHCPERAHCSPLPEERPPLDFPLKLPLKEQLSCQSLPKPLLVPKT